MTRREALELMAAAGLSACTRPARTETREMERTDAVEAVTPLGFPWQTLDPFLACMHHDDRYPPGDERFGPAASLAGRNIGQDFEGKDGWRMYHGEIVPGFPAHPHRGFETVTVVRHGLLDHSDSLGAAARYGGGDVQWLTAGGGILHAEMFPLLARDRENQLELFQIWLNLPARNKMVPAHFSMLWNGDIPRHTELDAEGRATLVTVIAGPYAGKTPPPAPPDSYASQPGSDLAIWTLKMAPGARYVLPAGRPGLNRALYFFRGAGLVASGVDVPAYHRVKVRSDVPVTLRAGGDEAELLVLQGRPIGEPVVQYGPFVMNSREEIRRAFDDYQRTRFGGWPWDRNDPVHGAEPGRFARFIDGRIERPG